MKLTSKEAKELLEIERQKAKDIASKLEGIVVKITASAGEDGRFFGSVTSMEISEKLKEQFGIEIDKKKLNLDSPIKAFGTYTVEAKLFMEIVGKINIVVIAK